jgi:predicted extracellular nuclease
LASIILQMNEGKGPDLLGFCEIENDYVLKLLTAALAPTGRNYAVAHVDMSDQRGIDVAFIYDSDRFSTTPEEQFSHFIVRRNATRDLFQVNFRTTGDNLLVMVGNHWPSRSGGQFETEPFRIMVGENLAYFHQRIIEKQGKETAVIAVGDFNDEPFNRSLVDYALSEKTAVKVKNATTQRFLNLMWPFLGQGIGSLYFDNTPNMLDQFLVSRGIVSGSSHFTVIPDSVEIVRFSEMVKPGVYPVPIRFGRGNNPDLDGFSDHFPIGLKLLEN